jgi:hypothetical protein
MKKLEGFFFDLYIHGSEFFADLRRLREEEQRKREHAERKRARAARILNRLQLVQRFDVWEATAHIERNFFGDNELRHERVKMLYAKKRRIEWVLTALYNYWAFDYVTPGLHPRKGLRWTRCCEMYRVLMESHNENVLQAKWDAKRAKVRQRRAKTEDRKAKNDALRAMGIDPKKKNDKTHTTSTDSTS